MSVGFLEIVQNVDCHRWNYHGVRTLLFVDRVDHRLHTVLVAGQSDRQTYSRHHHTAIDHTKYVKERHRNAGSVLIEMLRQPESMAGQKGVVTKVAVR